MSDSIPSAKCFCGHPEAFGKALADALGHYLSECASATRSLNASGFGPAVLGRFGFPCRHIRFAFKHFVFCSNKAVRKDPITFRTFEQYFLPFKHERLCSNTFVFVRFCSKPFVFVQTRAVSRSNMLPGVQTLSGNCRQQYFWRNCCLLRGSFLRPFPRLRVLISGSCGQAK